jgi:hypothetical protein
MIPDALEGLHAVENGDLEAFREAVEAHLERFDMTWSQFTRDLVRYAEPRIPDRQADDVRTKLGELTQVCLDLAWRETDEVGNETDDLQARALKATKDVLELLPKEEAHD